MNHLIKQIPVLILAFIFSLTLRAADEATSENAKHADSKSSVNAKNEINAQASEGTWKPIAAVLGGVQLQKPYLDAITLKITGDNYEVTITGEATDKGTCKLDLSASPKRMTITSTNGPNLGKTFLAIYEMKDTHSMRVCYDLSGTDFPKEFKAPKGTKFYLVGYRRQKE